MMHTEKMVLSQTRSERIVKNLQSAEEARQKCNLSPLVNLLNFNFRTIVAREYKTALIFFHFLLHLHFFFLVFGCCFPHGVAVK